jgi:hypothetical protein
VPLTKKVGVPVTPLRIPPSTSRSTFVRPESQGIGDGAGVRSDLCGVAKERRVAEADAVLEQ